MSSSQISEGGSSTITATNKNGETFTVDQTVTFQLAGTAAEGADYTITPPSITITAGGTSGTATITALSDSTTEAAETIVIIGEYDGQLIGTATIAIRASSSGGGGGGGSDDGGGEELPPRASELFEDVAPGVWYESAISWMILHRVTSGCTITMFCPENNLTRQQFVTFLWRAAGRPTPTYLGSEAFSDVTEGVYSDPAIGWAVSNGVTVGCTPGDFGDPGWRFCPTQHVTRGQMSTLLYRHVEADYPGATPSSPTWSPKPITRPASLG